jgi:hypothetical protein
LRAAHRAAPKETDMAKNRFEQVDEVQPDAITLSLWRQGEESFGNVSCPAEITGGRLAGDQVSEKASVVDAFRQAVRLANEIKAPLVVFDPDALWKPEWGDLYRES